MDGMGGRSFFKTFFLFRKVDPRFLDFDLRDRLDFFVDLFILLADALLDFELFVLRFGGMMPRSIVQNRKKQIYRKTWTS
jgi:hypothetical protein